MKIRLGYVALSKTIDITTSHTITYTNYKKDPDTKKLEKIINKNLDALEQILIYNKRNNIHFYRMSSNIFPLATHPNIKYNAIKIFANRLKKIGNIIKDNNMRVDIHLDQYCVLNSTNEEVVKSTINIIKFYKNMFKAMELKTKMIIHIGSATNGKQEGIKRFIDNFKKLDKESRSMLIIENDDKVYNVKDTLMIAQQLKIPMVLDYHHYICNNEGENINDYIKEIFKTWQETPKIHFSSPKNKKEKRAHHDYINSDDFINFLNKISKIKTDFDIMIEAKEKDNALFKLVRELKYKNYKFIDDTTLKI